MKQREGEIEWNERRETERQRESETDYRGREGKTEERGRMLLRLCPEPPVQQSDYQIGIFRSVLKIYA